MKRIVLTIIRINASNNIIILFYFIINFLLNASIGKLLIYNLFYFSVRKSYIYSLFKME